MRELEAEPIRGMAVSMQEQPKTRQGAGEVKFSFPVVILRFLEAAKHLGGSREI